LLSYALENQVEVGNDEEEKQKHRDDNRRDNCPNARVFSPCLRGHITLNDQDFDLSEVPDESRGLVSKVEQSELLLETIEEVHHLATS